MKIAASVTPNQTKFGPLLYPGDLEKALKVLSGLGYDGIELSLRTPGDIARDELYSMLNRHGMELISIATGQSYLEDGLSIFSSDPVKQAGVLERLKGHIDLAERSSASVILGGIKGSLDRPDDREQYDRGIEIIAELVEYAAPRGVVLLLESINRYEANIFNTVESALTVARELDSPALRVLPDTFHMNIEEVSLADSVAKAGAYVGALHCADSNRQAPGMGHLDFHPVIETAKQLPNLRYLGVEVLPLPDSDTCAETAIRTIRRYL
jgi:5-keto-L-gluconate epimerase